jgi:glycerophosphoryl diester phosphodiesterase
MRLRQRGAGGAALDEPPLFLDEVVAALARHPHRRQRVQLDIKEPAQSFDEAMLRRLRKVLGDVLSAFIVGTTDAGIFADVQRLAPEIAVGFDPLALHEKRTPANAEEFLALAETTRRLGPGARIYYLNADLVFSGLDAGVNLVERVARGKAEVDAWTVDPTRPNVRSDLRRLVEAGCDQITTNDPESLGSMLQELS